MPKTSCGASSSADIYDILYDDMLLLFYLGLGPIATILYPLCVAGLRSVKCWPILIALSIGIRLKSYRCKKACQEWGYGRGRAEHEYLC